MTETLAMKQYRAREIAQATLVKGDLCDWDGCLQVARDTHEIVNRGKTIGNDEARRLSFQKELCAQLCRQHHQQAHNPAMAEKLLLKNCQIYGYEQVARALAELETAMKSKLDIPFPSKEDVYA